METWQEWYITNGITITKETAESEAADVYDPKTHETLGTYHY